MRNFISDLTSTACLYSVFSRVKEPTKITRMKQEAFLDFILGTGK